MLVRSNEADETAHRPVARQTRPSKLSAASGLVDRVSRSADGAGASADGRHLASVIANAAAAFVTLDPLAIDSAIAGCLREVGEQLQLDRATLWVKPAGREIATATHSWINIASVSDRAVATTPYPRGTPEPPTADCGCAAAVDDVPDSLDGEAGLFCRRCSALRFAVAVADGSDGDRGALVFGAATEREWSPQTVEQLRVISAIIGQALTRKMRAKERPRGRGSLSQSPADAEAVRGGPRVGPRPDDLLRRDVPEPLREATIVGQSRALRRVLEQIQLVAVTDSTVLLLGETGVGKEVLATYLHDLSVRRARPMVRVNCSAIPLTLIESELFGREKGAFTGSLARQIGRFELADHSTIFLDEIGDLPADVQVKLLRVLEERQIERLGSPNRIRVDVRIVAATHRNLEERIVEGAFREDLFYRLNVFPIHVPPLRDRAEDIPALVWLFVDEFARAFGKRIDAIPRESMDALQRHAWPGNIRELRNVVERAMIVASGSRLTIPLPVRRDTATPSPHRSLKMVDVEREHVRSVLEMTRWRIRGQGGAAELLGLQPTTLETRMIKLGLHRPRS